MDNKRTDIATNPIEIKRIIRDYYEKSYGKKLDYLEETK